MRLEKIKLSGFKSFVNATTIDFPSNLVGIVGPNGCGKSNIIDAVRWVMGESSAKYLRGKYIADVIFNGSSHHKPLGRAVIEIIFDNSDGKLGGQYANYHQIAIRREIDRESQSNYYLNGTCCRRRDIMDIFSGTGLCQRSYAIIEQGMINTIIEAKPQELRAHFEEVAGIAKYKERRSDTENRMNRAKENLARLDDIINELAKQLSHLAEQSHTAKHYKVLKAKQYQLKTQKIAMHWQQFTKQIEKEAKLLNSNEILLKSKLARRQVIDTKLTALQQQCHDLTQDQTQQQLYQLSNEIANLEQTIVHHQAKYDTLTANQHQVQKTLEQLQLDINDDQLQREKLQAKLEQLQSQCQQAQTVHTNALNHLTAQEQQLQNLQLIWDDVNNQCAKASKQVDMEKARIDHLTEQQQETKERLKKLIAEQGHLDNNALEKQHQLLQQQTKQAQQQVKIDEKTAKDLKQQLANQSQENQAIDHQLSKCRQQLQTLQSRYTSLKTLQQVALRKESSPCEWLVQQGLEKKQRLIEVLHVAPGWEKAIEMVLGYYLEAVYVSKLEHYQDSLPLLTTGNLVLLTQSSHTDHPRHNVFTPLSDKIISPANVKPLVTGIYIANDLATALNMQHKLNTHESVITACGIWLGRCWLYIAKGNTSKTGILERECKLQMLAKDIASCQKSLQQLEKSFKIGREKLAKLEDDAHHIQSLLTNAHNKLATSQAKLHIHSDRLLAWQKRSQQLKQTIAVLSEKAHTANKNVNAANIAWQQAKQLLASDTNKRETLLAQREKHQQALITARQQVQKNREDWHHLETCTQKVQLQLQYLQQAKKREQTQYQLLKQRLADITTEQQQLPSLQGMKDQLEKLLAKRLQLEKSHRQTWQTLTALNDTLKKQQQERKDIECFVEKTRQSLEQQRLDIQEQKVRRNVLAKQLQQLNGQITVIINQLPQNTSIATLQQQLATVEKNINKLGAINLAAIDELKTLSQRKSHLTRQRQDLKQALVTLEGAISKINQEMQSKFSVVFNSVNQKFQQLFAHIFSGGSAYLELTGNNLLETGVAIIARPPGKRNSSIWLLSGGEKTLTAIALIFAMFQLNPAPFCMLDEVDAALDDINVSRFSNLLKQMSSTVQFIFISHNKITMEAAKQLMGVTMQEPGISSIVSVDIEKATAAVAK